MGGGGTLGILMQGFFLLKKRMLRAFIKIYYHINVKKIFYILASKSLHPAQDELVKVPCYITML